MRTCARNCQNARGMSWRHETRMTTLYTIGHSNHTWEAFVRLRYADRAYLRLGLTRPAEVGGYDETCWAQVTGVYTFPDYLGGKKFTDFDW